NADVVVTRAGDIVQHRLTVEAVEQNKVEWQGQSFTTLQLQGVKGWEGELNQVGKPDLPVLRQFFYSKPKVKVVGDAEAMTVTSPIAPKQHSIEKVPNPKVNAVMDQQAYRSQAAFPAVSFSIEEAGSVRGQQ